MTNLQTSLSFARSRLIKKGVEAGGKQFKQCLGILTIPADRIKVYEEWTNACLAAQSLSTNNGDNDQAATFADEYKRTLLAARKEFPAVGVFGEGASTEKVDVLMMPKNLEHPLQAEPKASVEVKLSDVGAHDRIKEQQHLGHIAETESSGGSSAVLGKHSSAAQAATFASPREDHAHQGAMQGSSSRLPPATAVVGDSTRPTLNWTTAEIASRHRQDQLREESIQHQPPSHGSPKRPLTDAHQMSAQDVAFGQEPAIKRLKGRTAPVIKQNQTVEHVGVNSMSMPNPDHDTVRSAGVNETNVTTVASCQVEGLGQGPGMEHVLKAYATDVHGATPEVDRRANISPHLHNQLCLAAPGISHSAFATSGSQQILVKQSQPVPSSSVWPLGQPQLLASAPPVQASVPMEHLVPVQQALPTDVIGTAESCPEDRRIVAQGTVAPQTEQAGIHVSLEKPQSQGSVGRCIQMTPSDRRLAPINSNLPQTRSKPPTQEGAQKRSKETEKFVYVKNVKYEKIALLGKGGSSRVCFILNLILAYTPFAKEVYKVSAPNQKEFAVKRVSFHKMSDDLRQGFKHEVDLLQKFAGTGGVIKMYSFEEFPLDEVMYMVLELGEMDMHTMLKKKRAMWAQQNQPDPFIADPNFICNLWHDILRSVKSVHDEKVVHSDLKPANFLISKGCVKLCDFGISKACGNNTTAIHREDQTGTLNYMSPEAVSGTSRVGRASDVWSLGCMLYEIAYGKLPFGHITQMHQKCQAIHRGHIDFKPISRSDVLDVLKRCLDPNPSRRATIKDLLEHPYVKASAGGQLTTQVMWEMHVAILRASHLSLSPDESKDLFSALQRARNCGRMVTADALLRQYIDGCVAPQPLDRAAVHVHDTVPMPPPQSGRLPAVSELPGGRCLTGGTGALHSRNVAGEPDQYRHQAARPPLADRTVSASTAAPSGHIMGNAKEPDTAHSVATTDEASTLDVSLGKQMIPGTKGSVVFELGKENVIFSAPTKETKQGISRDRDRVPLAATAAHPGDILEAKLQAIRHANASADEGHRASLLPQ